MEPFMSCWLLYSELIGIPCWHLAVDMLYLFACAEPTRYSEQLVLEYKARFFLSFTFLFSFWNTSLDPIRKLQKYTLKLGTGYWRGRNFGNQQTVNDGHGHSAGPLLSSSPPFFLIFLLWFSSLFSPVSFNLRGNLVHSLQKVVEAVFMSVAIKPHFLYPCWINYWYWSMLDRLMEIWMYQHILTPCKTDHTNRGLWKRLTKH